eukprot:UN12040
MENKKRQTGNGWKHLSTKLNYDGRFELLQSDHLKLNPAEIELGIFEVMRKILE